MDLSGLNDFSLAAARQLFERYPQLEPFSKIEQEHGQRYLAVAMPAPPEALTQHRITWVLRTSASARKFWTSAGFAASEVAMERARSRGTTP